MEKPINRKDKVKILKQVAKGNSGPLEAIRKEQAKELFSDTDIILAFYYLLEHGRPGEYKSALRYDECSITCMNDLNPIMEGFSILAETGSHATVETDGLKKILECMECFQFLRETKQLHLLNPYRKNLKKHL